MKKLFAILISLCFAFSAIAQTNAIATIPDAWTNSTQANYDSLTSWVVKGKLSAIPGTQKFYISSTWNPGNSQLNAIKVAGGDTEEWPLYWIVNDTNFFYQPVSSLLVNDIVGIRSSVNTPYKTWGDWLAQTHVIYFRSATNPDQYWILASDANGNLLKLSTMINIKNQYSTYMPGYVTQSTVDANQDKVQRNSEGVFP